ncbi:hypothetical protein NC652_035130 [Populus alba x Populus x berolinensis]|uniref:Uncharacterized protein n=1 Tax=Populus alba x Populus x berolinensis TaxID=444605 RepID=A0AAD6LQ38_9ROSI|nr:hypothetical protein NC651_034001 [Populus alba x Populus x berolinensis]KAJ6875652.1 hypothetical protein NC652_035130 [Populus alba x Populus x berolinensis]KAJ6970634.1 hypothetical protein NC653_035039 [Populus alba x Populus x berolinensis]
MWSAAQGCLKTFPTPCLIGPAGKGRPVDLKTSVKLPL